MADGVWYEVAPQGGPDLGTARLTSVNGLVAASSTAFPPQNPDATVYTLTPIPPQAQALVRDLRKVLATCTHEHGAIIDGAHGDSQHDPAR